MINRWINPVGVHRLPDLGGRVFRDGVLGGVPVAPLPRWFGSKIFKLGWFDLNRDTGLIRNDLNGFGWVFGDFEAAG
jgi:hypothetical protein